MNGQFLRVACLGAGYFSQFHIGSWRRIADVDLVGICDIDIERARGTGIPAFNHFETMLAAVRPDLVDIITPPAGQAAALRTAVALGIKHIICQKPFCRSIDEAQAIVAEAQYAGATIVVHENFRFQPWYRTIKSAISNGLIGMPLQATFRLRPGDGQRRDAYLDRQPYFQTMDRFLIHETGVHWIDTFRYFFGNPTAVYADLRKVNPVIKGEDAGYVIFDHPGGVRSVFDGNRCLDHAADNLRRTMGEALFEGTEGVLSLHGDGSVLHRPFHATKATSLKGADNWEGFGGDCVHALQNHVVQAIKEPTTLENTAEDYLTVLEIERAIYQSAASGRKIELAAP